MKRLYASVAISAFAFAAPVSAQSIANTIFLVDESGSMGGEQEFLRQFVLDIDPALAIAGFGVRNFGLLGFASPSQGTGPALLREFTVGTGQLGTAQEFADAALDLRTDGGTEDGYAAIDYALRNYPVSGGATFVLVTDEDRDDTDASLTYASILADLQAQGVNLAAILDVTIRNTNGDTAISTDGATALTQDGATFSSVPFDTFTGGDGNTIADYADLALATSGGCVADLNQLRTGGDAAAAFAAAFQTCVINAATESGLVAILSLPIRDASLTVAQDIRQKLRLLAQAMPGSGYTGGTLSTQGQFVDDLFEVRGLRGYAIAGGSFGSLAAGQDLDGQTLTFGLDYTFDAGDALARVGGALSYANTNVRNNLSSIGLETYQASAYGVYRMSSGLQFSGDLQAGRIDSDTARIVAGATLTGNTDADYATIGFEVGQRFAIAGSSAVLMPYGGLRHEQVSQDAYAESNGGVVPGFDQDLSTATIGLRYERDGFTNMGGMQMIFDASWNHIFSQDVDLGPGTVAVAPGTVDRNRLEMGLSFRFDAGEDSYVTVDLSGAKSDDVSIASVGVGFQMSF